MAESLYQRDVYGKTLVELGKVDPRIIVVDADLSGSTRTSLFAKEFPDIQERHDQIVERVQAGFLDCDRHSKNVAPGRGTFCSV